MDCDDPEKPNDLSLECTDRISTRQQSESTYLEKVDHDNACLKIVFGLQDGVDH